MSIVELREDLLSLGLPLERVHEVFEATERAYPTSFVIYDHHNGYSLSIDSASGEPRLAASKIATYGTPVQRIEAFNTKYSG